MVQPIQPNTKAYSPGMILPNFLAHPQMRLNFDPIEDYKRGGTFVVEDSCVPLVP
jgi:hypothetical protein